MLNLFHQWIVSLNTAERELRSQGYIVVYGGMTSLVIPIGTDEGTPQNRQTPEREWGAVPAALDAGSA